MINIRLAEENRPTTVRYAKFICDRCERNIELEVSTTEGIIPPSGWIALEVGLSRHALCAFCADEFSKWMKR